MVTVAGFVIGFTVLGSVWWAYHRFVLSGKNSGQRRPMPFWRRIAGSKEYELVAMHPA